MMNQTPMNEGENMSQNEMPSQNESMPESSMSMAKEHKGSPWGIVIIIIILIAGGIFILSSKNQTIAPTQNDVVETFTEVNMVDDLEVPEITNTSDDVSSIEQDLNSLDLENLDADL